MGTCSVCQGESFADITWKSHIGAEWPALECCTCGAITLRKHLEPSRAEDPGRSGVRRIAVYESGAASAPSAAAEISVRFITVPSLKYPAQR